MNIRKILLEEQINILNRQISDAKIALRTLEQIKSTILYAKEEEEEQEEKSERDEVQEVAEQVDDAMDENDLNSLLEALSTANTRVWKNGSYIWIDTLKNPEFFEREAKKYDKDLEIIHREDDKACLTGRAAHGKIFGGRECACHVYRVML